MWQYNRAGHARAFVETREGAAAPEAFLSGRVDNGCTRNGPSFLGCEGAPRFLGFPATACCCAPPSVSKSAARASLPHSTGIFGQTPNFTPMIVATYASSLLEVTCHMSTPTSLPQSCQHACPLSGQSQSACNHEPHTSFTLHCFRAETLAMRTTET